MELVRLRGSADCETAERDEDFLSAAEEPFYAPSWTEKSPPCATYPRVPSPSRYLLAPPSKPSASATDAFTVTPTGNRLILSCWFSGGSHTEISYFTHGEKTTSTSG